MDFFLLRGRIILQGRDLLELVAHIVDIKFENNGTHRLRVSFKFV